MTIQIEKVVMESSAMCWRRGVDRPGTARRVGAGASAVRHAAGGGDLWGRLARYQEREAALEGSRDEVGRNPLDQALKANEMLDEQER
jgi:hypothetical protein